MFKVLVLQMFNKYILKEKSNNTIASTDLHDCLVFLNCVVFEKREHINIELLYTCEINIFF